MLLRAHARSCYAFLMLASLLLDAFPRRRQVGSAADRCGMPRLALVDCTDEALPFGSQFRKRAIENHRTLTRLLELCASRPSFAFVSREQILAVSRLGLSSSARFFQPLELKARVVRALATSSPAGQRFACPRGDV